MRGLIKFDSLSALWHSSGMCGGLAWDAPVGTLSIDILDHLTLALGWGMVGEERSP